MKFRLPFTRGRLSISRAPQGARGLKCGLWVLAEGLIYVAPRKGRVG